MVLRTQLLFHLIRDGIEGIDGIQSGTTLKTGACLLPHQPKQPRLFLKVIYTLVNVTESVDLVPTQVGCCSGQILIEGVLGDLIGHSHGIQRRTYYRMLNAVFYSLAQQIHRQPQRPYASKYSSFVFRAILNPPL